MLMNMAGCISEQRWTDQRWNEIRQKLKRGALVALTILPCLGANKLTDVRYWSVGDVTRVAIEVSGDFRFTAGKLSGPDRVYFDIPDTTPTDKKTTIPVADGRVKQIRIAETEPMVTRVVVDLENGAEYSASRLSNPERLMVELRPRGTRVSKVPMVEPPATRTVVPTPPPVTANTSRSTPAPKPAADAVSNSAAAPQPAARNSNGDRSLTRVLGLKIGTVVIDAGHGGNDQGTKGKSGLLEKDLTLDVANRVAALLKDRLGVNVIMTRSDDTYVGLEDRTLIANKTKADLFLSIHANWNPAKSVAGVDTYYRYFSASREDLDLATRENAGTTRSVFDLGDTVTKIAARAKVDESREFATLIQKPLHAAAAKENPDARSRAVKRAPFVVLIGAEMPSVLAEIGFLSNPKEEQLLNSDAHRDRLAEALYEGIDKYFTSMSHSEVARAVE